MSKAKVFGERKTRPLAQMPGALWPEFKGNFTLRHACVKSGMFLVPTQIDSILPCLLEQNMHSGIDDQACPTTNYRCTIQRHNSKFRLSVRNMLKMMLCNPFMQDSPGRPWFRTRPYSDVLILGFGILGDATSRSPGFDELLAAI